MTTIKDSVHSHIDIDGIGADLLDTPPVQRLRHIRQLGTVQLVYPSANHTRFEHSLGVYHLTRRALRHLDIDGREATRLEAAALLHDIGHAPFSHNLEPVLRHVTGSDHDAIAHLLADPALADVLERYELDPARLADLIEGRGQLGQLLAGELDVDRMDYLVRDAHHTGVPYGTIDPGRLLRELTFVDGSLALTEGNVQSAENLLVARALMNPTVYNHHVARISKAMLRRGMWRLFAVEGSGLPVEPVFSRWFSGSQVHPLRQATDYDVIFALGSSDRTRDLVRRLLTRRLYKRAVWAERGSVPEELLAHDDEDLRGLESSIADRASVSPEHVLLDVPGQADMTEASSRVLVNGEVRRLDEQSPLVEALQANHRAQWRLGVYTLEAHTSPVGEAAVSVLGLDLPGPRIQRRRQGLHRQLEEFGIE